MWRDNDFLLPSKVLKTPPLVVGQSAESTQRKARGRGAVALLAWELLRSEVVPTTQVTLHIVAPRFRLVSAV